MSPILLLPSPFVDLWGISEIRQQVGSFDVTKPSPYSELAIDIIRYCWMKRENECQIAHQLRIHQISRLQC